MPTIDQFTEEYEHDITWLILLWLLIHGGDPGPDGTVEVPVSETSLTLAGMLSASLAESTGMSALTKEELQEGLERAIGAGLRDENTTFCPKGTTPVRMGNTVVCVPTPPQGGKIYVLWPFGGQDRL